MQAATILPQAYLNHTVDDTYHMCLAHLIDEPGFEHYTLFYRQIGHTPGKFLIMDNGVIEGNPRPLNELITKAHLILADELVLPDVYQNKKATLKAVYESLRYMDSMGEEISTMAVPQGDTYQEWIDCAKEMLNWPINTLGIPKVVCKMAGRNGRLLALQELQGEIADAGVQVHLLGCWESPLEVKVIESAVRSNVIDKVRGVDSAIAYVYAKHGIKICDDARPAGAVDFTACDANEEVLKFNIELWRSECGALPESSNVHRIW
jgi:hypothetical protein